jgi:hypothetical protein
MEFPTSSILRTTSTTALLLPRIESKISLLTPETNPSSRPPLRRDSLHSDSPSRESPNYDSPGQDSLYSDSPSQTLPTQHPPPQEPPRRELSQNKNNTDPEILRICKTCETDYQYIIEKCKNCLGSYFYNKEEWDRMLAREQKELQNRENMLKGWQAYLYLLLAYFCGGFA